MVMYMKMATITVKLSLNPFKLSQNESTFFMENVVPDKESLLSRLKEIANTLETILLGHKYKHDVTSPDLIRYASRHPNIAISRRTYLRTSYHRPAHGSCLQELKNCLISQVSRSVNAQIIQHSRHNIVYRGKVSP
jgi:hypothetical protein